jgi:uncharacterized protein with GYD domain
MATYVLFGKYSPEALKSISAKRTDDALALIRQYGGEFKSGYALLGDVDLVMILDLPDTERAMQVGIELTKLLGVAFRTAPAVSIEEFDRLMSKP